jgi:hypothetical protein
MNITSRAIYTLNIRHFEQFGQLTTERLKTP